MTVYIHLPTEGTKDNKETRCWSPLLGGEVGVLQSLQDRAWLTLWKSKGPVTGWIFSVVRSAWVALVPSSKNKKSRQHLGWARKQETQRRELFMALFEMLSLLLCSKYSRARSRSTAFLPATFEVPLEQQHSSLVRDVLPVRALQRGHCHSWGQVIPHFWGSSPCQVQDSQR